MKQRTADDETDFHPAPLRFYCGEDINSCREIKDAGDEGEQPNEFWTTVDTFDVKIPGCVTNCGGENEEESKKSHMIIQVLDIKTCVSTLVQPPLVFVLWVSA